MLGRLPKIFGEERENYINLGDYGKDDFIIDDRMLEEQLKVVDEYMKKFEEKEKKHDKKRT